MVQDSPWAARKIRRIERTSEDGIVCLLSNTALSKTNSIASRSIEISIRSLVPFECKWSYGCYENRRSSADEFSCRDWSLGEAFGFVSYMSSPLFRQVRSLPHRKASPWRTHLVFFYRRLRRLLRIFQRWSRRILRTRHNNHPQEKWQYRKRLPLSVYQEEFNSKIFTDVSSTDIERSRVQSQDGNLLSQRHFL